MSILLLGMQNTARRGRVRVLYTYWKFGHDALDKVLVSVFILDIQNIRTLCAVSLFWKVCRGNNLLQILLFNTVANLRMLIFMLIFKLIFIFIEIHISEATRVGVKKERQEGEAKLQIFILGNLWMGFIIILTETESEKKKVIGKTKWHIFSSGN